MSVPQNDANFGIGTLAWLNSVRAGTRKG